MIKKGIAIFSAVILTVVLQAPALAGKGSSHAASTPQQKLNSPYKPSGTNKSSGTPGVLSGKRVTSEKVLQMKKTGEANTAGQQKRQDQQDKTREEAQKRGQQEQAKPEAKQNSSGPLDTFMPSANSQGTGQKTPSDNSGGGHARPDETVVRSDDHRELKGTSGVSGASSADVLRARNSQ